MTFEEYVTYKLSLKLNYVYSKGVDKSGVISQSLINRLASNVCDFGRYYVVTKMSFPIDLVMSDTPPSGSIIIDFTPDELRNKKLVSILK